MVTFHRRCIPQRARANPPTSAQLLDIYRSEGIGMLNRHLVSALLIFVIACLAACGGGARHSATTTLPRPTVPKDPFLATGDPLAVTKGMTKSQVRRISGRPLISPTSPLDRDCW